MNEMRDFLVSHTGPVLFLVIFAEQIGLPFPAAPVLVAAGALAAESALDPTLALGVTVLASVLADVIWFYAGRRGGDTLLRWLFRFFHRDNSSFERTERLFAKHGMSAVAAAKFLPWLGVLIPPLAGAFRVGFGKFLRFDALGSLLYGTFYMGLGFLFTEEVNAALESLSDFSFGTIAPAAAVVAAFVAYKFAKRRKGRICLQ